MKILQMGAQLFRADRQTWSR